MGNSGRALPCGIPPRAGPRRGARGLKVLQAWFLCLLLLGLALRGATCPAHQHSMETRTPDIDPAWYTGRRIRPVGRFGRRRVALRNAPEDPVAPAVGFPLEGGAERSQGG
ncbi:LOW QUALITY PROTEIN: prolactin-releasing peptide [Myotis daubentonii]|uniref:LOW QUALITY PROTEIN: prolactin-releasing peptide n=1 Tax=Myotis daubentonii TaxID=98922 RepID=UPI002873DD1E|nr:LOW QUALITY PROTEIN: prolactin-releasing peptide [Myotis daubentonii]